MSELRIIKKITIFTLIVFVSIMSDYGYSAISTQERVLSLRNEVNQRPVVSGVLYNLGQANTCFLPTMGRPNIVPQSFQVPYSSEDIQNNELISALSSQFPLCNLQEQEELMDFVELVEDENLLEQPVTDIIPLDLKMYQTNEFATTLMDNLTSGRFVNRMRNLLLPNMFRPASIISEENFSSIATSWSKEQTLLSTILKESDETDGGSTSEGDSQAENSLPLPSKVARAEFLQGCAAGTIAGAASTLVVAYMFPDGGRATNVAEIIVFGGVAVTGLGMFKITENITGLQRGNILTMNEYSVGSKTGFFLSNTAGIFVCSFLTSIFLHEAMGVANPSR